MIAVQEEEYEALRAFLVAIGRFGEARGNDGKSLGRLLAQFPLLAYARQSLDEDAFFRDGITRGLERLGPVALDVLREALRTGTPEESSAALYALQGWRGRDGRDVLMSTAISDDPIPAEARANLFAPCVRWSPTCPPNRSPRGWPTCPTLRPRPASPRFAS